MDITKWTIENFRVNEAPCLEMLKDSRNWREIPLVNYANLDNIPDNSLVRFRGMIQDMLDPEIYLEKYEIKTDDNSCRIQDGRLRDCLALQTGESVNYESQNNVHGERRTMFIVSIPGINCWVTEYENALTKPKDKCIETTSNGSTSQKRPADEHEEMEVDADQSTSKRIRTEKFAPPNNSSGLLSSEYLLNSPIPDRPSKACMVKIYSDFDNHMLNTVVDVIGFLSVDPSLDGSNEEPSEFQELSELHASNPPPSLIPRIHAVMVKKLQHFNPLLDVSFMENNGENEIENMEAIHKDLQIVLTQCLFGDKIAADYLLSHLISTVYVRTELQTLGQFTLNIYNIPTDVLPEYTKNLYEIIELLLPASHYFPMTLENMNTLQFIPKKDYKTNKLTSGLLQLAPHTHLILDETQLQPGKLESGGITAVQNLGYLIKTQQIKCNFEFYEINFNANIPILILSEGRSLLSSNCQIPLMVDSECVKLITETFKAAKHYLQPKLNIIRKYLTLMKIREFNMSPVDTEMIEQDFVEMRKQNKNVGAEDLHSHLVLSRLLGLAKGKDLLDKESWTLSKQMECTRKERIGLLTKKKL